MLLRHGNIHPRNLRSEANQVAAEVLRGLRLPTILLAFAISLQLAATAQTNPPAPKVFNLEDTINYAIQNYPAIRAAIEQASAARSGVTLAKTSYLPRADMLWQGNRGTRNNIFGILLPQSVISPISGPVLPSTSNESVWGSAAGLLVSWEPFDFGRRGASVDSARAGERLAESGTALTRLDVAMAATNAFFDVMAAHQRALAATADVDRRQVFADSVHTLVNNQLRPGADASRADAELARSRVLLIQVQQTEAISRTALAEFLGRKGNDIQIDAGTLLSSPPDAAPTAAVLASHPSAVAEHARLDQILAQEHVLQRTYFPRFTLQSTIYGRGSGANVDGTVQDGADGLGFSRANWAAGLTVTFSAFDIFAIRARKQIEAANERSQRATYEQTLDDLSARLEQSKDALEGARKVAVNTPIELQAARDAETQARARYEAALGTIVEVAEAQGLLAQAEADDALARLAVWNDLASVSASQGDLQPFMQLLHQKTQGGP